MWKNLLNFTFNQPPCDVIKITEKVMNLIVKSYLSHHHTSNVDLSTFVGGRCYSTWHMLRNVLRSMGHRRNVVNDVAYAMYNNTALLQVNI